MLFNSLEFAIFLPIVFFLYWFVFSKDLRIQNVLILSASYYFYGCWDYRFLALIEPDVRALVDASKRAEIMMDGCALLGIGNWLYGQYREDWATIHTELQEALEPWKDPSDV